MASKKNNKKNENLDNNKNNSKISVVWYPGHMVKAQNDIKSVIKLIDIVVEVLDARIPLSSRNPIIDELAKDKQRIIVLNKSDLADDEVTKNWINYFKSKDISCISVNSEVPQDIKSIVSEIVKKGEIAYKEKIEKLNIEYKPIYRVLIAGIPNVGKSTIINKIAKKNSANVSNKPGVTVKNQWIRVQDNIDLLDTPGLLWPKLDENNAGEKLALTGNIKQEILDLESIACLGIEMLLKNDKYKNMFLDKYKINEEDIDSLDYYDILELLGRKRGCLISGGNVDMLKASKVFLDELKSGKIGRISLENI